MSNFKTNFELFCLTVVSQGLFLSSLSLKCNGMSCERYKENIISFSKETLAFHPVIINDTQVDLVEECMYLDQTSDAVIKKSH